MFVKEYIHPYSRREEKNIFIEEYLPSLSKERRKNCNYKTLFFLPINGWEEENVFVE